MREEERDKQSRLMNLHNEFLSLLEIGAHSDDENEDEEALAEEDANKEEVKGNAEPADTTIAATAALEHTDSHMVD